jgi:predicted regulator of Ras-like GTPase activity (Roadblock/LC7/MglB family)
MSLLPESRFLAIKDESGGWIERIKGLICRILAASDTPDSEPTAIDRATLEELVLNTQKLIDEPTMIQFSRLKDHLQNFVSSTPDVQGAALVSPDGLPLASVLSAAFEEERMAAMSAAMLSLGERIGQELDRGTIDRIFVEGEKGYSILVNCGADAVLLVLANKTAKQGLLFLEIKRLTSEIMLLI